MWVKYGPRPLKRASGSPPLIGQPELRYITTTAAVDGKYNPLILQGVKVNVLITK
jgi:hypothetical protein